VVKEYIKKYNKKVVSRIVLLSSIDPKTKSRSFASIVYYNNEAVVYPNLYIITEALIERIILEKQNILLRATGI
jgi:hypothetical protein